MLKKVKPWRMASGIQISGLSKCHSATPQAATIPNWRAATRRWADGRRTWRARSSAIGTASRSWPLNDAISFQYRCDFIRTILAGARSGSHKGSFA